MAKIKLAYPKIAGSKNIEEYNKECIAFEKYDGTNLHWVWQKELGWYAFGTRRNRFNFDDKGIKEFHTMHFDMEESTDIFTANFANPLSKIFSLSYPNFDEITVFTEFLGSLSFAGRHKNNDPKQLVLFDVETPQGMVFPDQFVEHFQSVNIARVVYRGKLNGRFIENVRTGKYQVKEGVVCKTKCDNGVKMVKIKTNAYMQKLKSELQKDWENYWE